MKTADKIRLARAAYKLVRFGLRLVGKNDRASVVRGQVRFDLELSEGIDFAIFIGAFERATQRALSKLVKSSSTVLDIGANVGAHTLLLAKLVGEKGRVLAFEPTDFAYGKLRHNLALNPELAARVRAFQCFLTVENNVAVPSTIYSSWPLVARGETHAKHLGREMPTASASSRSLDSVLSEAGVKNVDLVKLDVDGYECDVLRGASTLLTKMRPIFVMELAPYVLHERGASLEELISIFIRSGYQFFDERTGQALPSTAAQLRKLVGDGESRNVIART